MTTDGFIYRWFISVPFAAIGKGSVRLGIVGGHARAFKDSETRSWMCTVAQCAAPVLPSVPLEGPLAVEIVAVLPRPDRLLRRSKRTGELLGGASEGLMYAPTKPDADNIAKGILDALKSHWRDDRQVVALSVQKYYCEAGGMLRTEIRVGVLSGSDTEEVKPC